MAATDTNRRARGAVRGRSVRGRSIVLVLLGVALAALSYTQLPWYSVDIGADSAGNGFLFADLHDNADRLSAPVAAAYFDWLGWTVLVALAVVGIAAAVPSPIANALRVVGFVLGLLGAIGTYYALAQLFNAQRVAGGSDHSVLHSASLGVWLTLGGFVLAGVGAVLGPRTDS